jgi:hypothetical protein
MDTTETIVKLEVWHKDYNLDKKDNLSEVPTEKAVFGIFGIVNEEPINCRYVAEAENLRDAVKDVFENPQGEGMKKFMQGPWIQMLVYELMPGSAKEDREKVVEEWKQKHDPKIDEEGEYPGYYDY